MLRRSVTTPPGYHEEIADIGLGTRVALSRRIADIVGLAGHCRAAIDVPQSPGGAQHEPFNMVTSLLTDEGSASKSPFKHVDEKLSIPFPRGIPRLAAFGGVNLVLGQSLHAYRIMKPVRIFRQKTLATL